MRKTIMFTICITILSFGMIDSATTSELNYDKLIEDDKLRKEAEELKIKKYHEDELNRFLTDIGFRESGNRYDITNTWGYMGKYQFGKSTLKVLGDFNFLSNKISFRTDSPSLIISNTICILS